MYYPMREANFVPEWMDMKPDLPVPRIDWIKEKYLDIPYGKDQLQTLDLYLPNHQTENMSLLIIVHGGGFSHMDKRDWHLYPGFYALREGFALASVNYRLAPKDKYPSALNDLKSAILLLKEIAADHNISKENFFLYGTSAGGNLVSVIALQGAKNDEDYSVNAVAGLCGAYNLHSIISRKKQKSKSFRDFYEKFQCEMLCKAYIGKSIKKSEAELMEASADSYLTKKAPPFYIQHGTKDEMIPYEYSVTFYENLKNVTGYDKKDLVLHLMEGAKHGGSDHFHFEEENILPIIEFFRSHIKSGEENAVKNQNDFAR